MTNPNPPDWRGLCEELANTLERAQKALCFAALSQPEPEVVGPSPTLPTIHLNGTSRETLRADYTKAYRALVAFREALRSVEFNARDYYVQGPDAYFQARTERDAQFERIGDLMRYLESHLIHLGPIGRPA